MVKGWAQRVREGMIDKGFGDPLERNRIFDDLLFVPASPGLLEIESKDIEAIANALSEFTGGSDGSE